MNCYQCGHTARFRVTIDGVVRQLCGYCAALRAQMPEAKVVSR